MLHRGSDGLFNVHSELGVGEIQRSPRLATIIIPISVPITVKTDRRQMKC